MHMKLATSGLTNRPRPASPITGSQQNSARGFAAFGCRSRYGRSRDRRDHDRRRRRSHGATTARNADARALLFDFKLGQSRFLEQLCEFADQVLIDVAFAFGHNVFRARLSLWRS